LGGSQFSEERTKETAKDVPLHTIRIDSSMRLINQMGMCAICHPGQECARERGKGEQEGAYTEREREKRERCGED
jgi:hypothetical protein